MLKITFKDLSCQTFSVEIDENFTVKDLKELLHEKRGLDYSADKQVMIYDGKVLREDSVISSLKINPEKFVVVMKKKSPPTPKECETKPSTSQTEVKEAGDGVKKKKSKDSVSSRKSSTTNTRKKSNDSLASTSTTTISSQSTIPSEVTLHTTLNTNDNPLLVLQTNPEFLRIRDLLDRDPTQINAVVDHIATTCPELLDVISKNRENFFELMGVDKATMMLYEGGAEEKSEGTRRAGRAGSEVLSAPTAAAGPDASRTRRRSPLRRFEPESNTSRLMRTSGRPLESKDIEAIERLKSMGFDEQMAIQAYFACEKDENAAANFLLQQHDDI